jgi:hypothetical protein
MYHTLSTVCGSEAYPTFPYRPRPKTRRRSPGLQRKVHVRELVNSIAWPRSLRPIARVIVAVAQFMCLIVAQYPSRRARVKTAAKFSIHRPLRHFHHESVRSFSAAARWIRAIIQIECASDEHTHACYLS